MLVKKLFQKTICNAICSANSKIHTIFELKYDYIKF